MHERARNYIAQINANILDLADEALAVLSDGDGNRAAIAVALESIVEDAQIMEHAIQHPRFLNTGYFKERTE